jgi:D-alanyl-D-alanine carboxypeptidase
MEQNNKTKFTTKLLYSLNIFLIVLIAFLFVAIYSKRHPVVAQKPETKIHYSEPIQNIDITAKSAYVYDVVGKQVLYRKNELKQLPLASLTKLMMALTAAELLPRDADIKIKKEFLEEDGDNGLLANESWKLSDLLDFSLVVSSNDGARSIASVIGAMQLDSKDFELGRKEFIRKMNQKAQELGLSQTYFVNESGLDVGNTSGGYGTAVDIANLLRYTIENKPQILEATRYKKLSIDSEDKEHTATNTNKEVDDIPGLIASKTGFTDLAGGNLAVAFDASMGRPIIVVVLGSTQDGRFKDVQKLVNASLETISK